MKDIKTIYVVCWGNATQDDDGNNSAYSGVHGIYCFPDDAKVGLEACKTEMLNCIVNDDPDLTEEEREQIRNSIQICGSVEHGFFEIDYSFNDCAPQLYIHIVKKELTI
jgi:hypothetical protein